MSYSIIDGTAYGFVPLSIFDIIEHLPEFFGDFGMLMVCSDSCRKLADTRHSSNEIWQDYQPYGDAIWMPSSWVTKQIQTGWIFDGFEEIYLLPQPEKVIKLSDHNFTTDATFFSTQIPAEFLRQFANLRAVRFLSDGCGLNYACEPHLAEAIENLDKYLQGGDSTNSFESDSPGDAPRRAYYLPLTAEPNSVLERNYARRPTEE